MGLLISIVIGIIAGAVAGKLTNGKKGGLLVDLFVGLIGGLVGGWLFEKLGIEWGGLLGQCGTAIVGAVVILWVASLLKK